MKVVREEAASIKRYARRVTRGLGSQYAPLNPAAVLAVQQRDRVLAHRLASTGWTTMRAAKILDIGCGRGVELARLLQWGATPANLCGVDLLADRVAAAEALHPSMTIVEGSATALPWPSGNFDVVMQHTTFSSIVDPQVRRLAATEAERVLRPGGLILWYDFVWNPFNRETRGLPGRSVRALFPDFDVWLRRVTLAPPLSRALAMKHPLVTRSLHEFRPLCTHLVGVLTKPS
jgi:ubiquinone/menaquinone biosynthesis C-methylase UbiE